MIRDSNHKSQITNGRSGLVALGVHSGGMQEHGFVFPEATYRHVDDVPRARQTRLGVSDDAAALAAFCLEPPVHEIEALAAVIDLHVLASRADSCPEDA